MYQTVGHNAIDLYAQAMNLPLYRETIQGSSISQGKVYTELEEDEVEDLYRLLKKIKVLFKIQVSYYFVVWYNTNFCKVIFNRNEKLPNSSTSNLLWDYGFQIQNPLSIATVSFFFVDNYCLKDKQS